jgi:pimeloyl-ACP methyl ester carboxylesterase
VIGANRVDSRPRPRLRPQRFAVPALALWLALALCPIPAPAATAPKSSPRLSIVTGAGNVHLLVAEVGDPAAPGILFIHGFAQSYLSFRRQFDSELATRYHLVAFDLRGHGGSDKPGMQSDYEDSRLWADDVAAVMKATGLERPVIVGWSYGGFVAADYLRHYGTANVAGVNLVGSLGGLVATAPFSAGTSQAARRMHARSEAQRSLNLLDNIIAGKETAMGYVTENMSVLDREILFATEMMLPAYTRRFMMARRLDNTDLAPKLDLPVLLSRGSGDLTMPPEALDMLLRTLRNARLSAYSNTGHLVFVERPGRFDRELAAFVDSVQKR